MTTTDEQRPTGPIDVLDRGFCAEPFEGYATLRGDEPISYDEVNGLWVLSRFDDVSHVSVHPEQFCSGQGVRPTQSFDLSLIALFGYLLGLGLALRDRPTDASLYRSLCVLLVIFFIISISRAWELLGARDTGFIHLLAGRLDRPRQDRAGELSEDATPLEPPR